MVRGKKAIARAGGVGEQGERFSRGIDVAVGYAAELGFDPEVS